MRFALSCTAAAAVPGPPAAALPVAPEAGALRRHAAVLALLFLALCAWDATGLDMALARWFGSANGFAWRSVPGFVLAFHEVPRALSMLLLAALVLGVVWPFGFLRGLALGARVQLAASVLGAVAVATLIKHGSSTSCPWDLAEFGGVARHVSHWAWGLRDGGPGRCFPGGHASAAFGFVAGWWVLRRGAPRVAGVWLAVALLAGLVLGGAQQVRGAHFMSHTFWSAWVCAATGFALECAVAAWRATRLAPRQVPS